MSVVLPHNLEAEASVLGAVLLRGSEALFEALEHVDEGDFFLAQHAAVFAAAAALGARDVPIDAVTLEAELERRGTLKLAGGLGFLAHLSDKYASAHHLAHHAETVRSLGRARSVAVAAAEVVDDTPRAGDDPRGWVDRQEQRILDAAARGRREVARGPDVLLKGVFEAIRDRSKSKSQISGVATGFEDLDRLTGGMQPKELTVIAARPSMGKTALVLNIAAHATVPQQRHAFLAEADRPAIQPVLFFSLEMSAEQLMGRLLCAEARVDYGLMRTGAFLPEDLQRLVAAAGRIQKSKLYIDDSPAPSILEMRARARRFRNRRDLFVGAEGEHGLVIVDYLQLARGSQRRYDLREQEISEISRGLKAMAKELKMPVLALSQLNRAVDSRTDHRPQLSDLRESGAIEQDADTIMFIYRAERYLSPDAPEAEKKKVAGRAEVIVGKQRNGPIGTAELTFVKHLAKFEDLSKESHGTLA